MVRAMRQPLGQFADRIIRNGEVKEFIEGLMEQGVNVETIVCEVLAEHSIAPQPSGPLINEEMYDAMVRPRRYAGPRRAIG